MKKMAFTILFSFFCFYVCNLFNVAIPSVKAEIVNADYHFQQAMEYRLEADNEFRSQRVPSLKIYPKVLLLYDKSERQLQHGLERSKGAEERKRIESTILELRSKKDILRREEKKLEESIKNAIKDKRWVLGMTKLDVVKSLGNPTKINRANYGGSKEDQWIYRDEKKRTDLYLYFEADVLVSAQF